MHKILLAGIMAGLAAEFVAQGAPLRVAAASDLSMLGPELGSAFTAQNPGTQVEWAYGASGSLAHQIEQGAPFDVFLSANAEYVERLADRGVLRKGTVRTYALGQLAVAWRDGKSHPLTDLLQQKIVALANPKLAPYGLAARQAMEHAGLWAKLQGRLAMGENVRQALELFESGNADAVLTSAALLDKTPHDLVDGQSYGPIVQKGGVVAATRQPEQAAAFLRFLGSGAGGTVLGRHGFLLRSAP